MLRTYGISRGLRQMKSEGPLLIDGSYGEGGGQILRTSVAFSALMGLPIKVINIRAKRDRPGLRLQHIGAIKAAALLCDAEAKNLEVGAIEMSFTPGKARASSFKLDVGSAGSITLLLQAAIPVAALSGKGAEIEVSGGTDVKWSPTMDYFRRVVLPAYRLVGLSFELEVVRRGYYPRGGGTVRVRVMPAQRVNPLDLVSAEVPPPSILSVCSNLPRSVAERQKEAAMSHLLSQGVEVASTESGVEQAPSPGSSIVIYSVRDGGPFLASDAIGERGKPAEVVGREAAELYLKEHRSGAPVDVHMGDMLVPLLSLAKGESRFRVSRVSQHLITNLHVASLFTNSRYEVEEQPDGTAVVTIRSADREP